MEFATDSHICGFIFVIYLVKTGTDFLASMSPQKVLLSH